MSLTLAPTVVTFSPFPIRGECKCPDLVAATVHYPSCLVGALTTLEAQCDPFDSTTSGDTP